jgi:hypothetical protein
MGDGTADIAFLHRNPDGGINVQFLWGSKVNTPFDFERVDLDRQVGTAR